MSSPTDTHPTIAQFGVFEGELLAGGVALSRLAERVGSTPFFAYDRKLLDRRAAELRTYLPKRVSLSYAIKANPMPAVVQHMRGLVDGFDVASGHELRVALDTTMPSTSISFAGPGKTDAELRQGIASGATLELESELEMRRATTIGAALGIRPRVSIRVNPAFRIRASAMRMGGGPSQFGVDAERVPKMLHDLHALGLDLMGFHVFSGSQNLQAEILSSIQQSTIELVVQLAQHAKTPVTHVNLGGGFGVPYFPKDAPLDLAGLGSRLGEMLRRDFDSVLPDAKVIVELGRYLVAEAGIYVSRVIDRKVSGGQTFLITDGGLHHQLAASGNFGQVIRRNYPVAIGTRMGSAATEEVSVVGCLCTPLDLLADKVALPAADVGDLFVVFLSGAYGYTASPTAFLGHPPPVEVLI